MTKRQKVRLLFADELAAVIGVDAKTIKFYNQDGKKARAAGKATLGTFPEPVDTVPRPVWNGHHNVTVHSNRWKLADIIVWLENRASNPRWPDLADRSKEVAAQLRAAPEATIAAALAAAAEKDAS